MSPGWKSRLALLCILLLKQLILLPLLLIRSEVESYVYIVPRVCCERASGIDCRPLAIGSWYPFGVRRELDAVYPLYGLCISDNPKGCKGFLSICRYAR